MPDALPVADPRAEAQLTIERAARIGVPVVESPTAMTRERAAAEFGYAQCRHWTAAGDRARADAWQGWAKQFWPTARDLRRRAAERAAKQAAERAAERAARNDHILALWVGRVSAKAIAQQIGISARTVRNIVFAARKAGDPRAANRKDQPANWQAIRDCVGRGVTRSADIGAALGMTAAAVDIHICRTRKRGVELRATPCGNHAAHPIPTAAGLPSGTAAGDAPGGLVTSGLRSSSWHAAAPGGGGEAHSAAQQHNEQHDHLGAEHQNSEREQQVVLPPLARSVVVGSGQVSQVSPVRHVATMTETLK